MLSRRAFVGSFVVFTGIAISGIALYENKLTVGIEAIDGEQLLIAELAETIIPRTQTVGAKDVNAEKTIVMLLKECTDVRTQKRFMKGLFNLKDYCEETFGKRFEMCNEAEKIQVLERFEKKVNSLWKPLKKLEAKFAGRSFFEVLKEYTLYAYCTSLQGATVGMFPIPNSRKQRGCANINEIRNAYNVPSVLVKR